MNASIVEYFCCHLKINLSSHSSKQKLLTKVTMEPHCIVGRGMQSNADLKMMTQCQLHDVRVSIYLYNIYIYHCICNKLHKTICTHAAFNHGLRKNLHFRRHNEYYTNTTVGTSDLYTFSSEKSLRSGKIIMNLRLCPTHTQFDACGWLLNAIKSICSGCVLVWMWQVSNELGTDVKHFACPYNYGKASWKT